MSFDLTRLLEPLARSADAELDASDDRLLGPDAHASKGDFVSAAREAEALLEAGVYDLRPMPYCLYQAFVDGGYPALSTILGVTENLLGPSREALMPEKRRDDYLNRRWHWLFDKIDCALAFQEKAGSVEWQRWQSGLSRATLDELRLVGKRVSDALAAPAFQQAGMVLARLLARISEQRPVDDEARQPCTSSLETRPASQAPPSFRRIDSEAPLRRPDGLERVELSVSPRFSQLCRSIEAFEVLVQKGQFLKAAVVLADISESLNHFDPRVYFPSLFAPFASLYSKHVNALTEQTDERSPAWQALRQHYQVDLQGFVES